MKNLRYKIITILPALVWAALIFYLSSLSTLPSAQKFWWDFYMKKSAHMFVYAVLYYLVVKAFGKVTYKTLLLSFVICVVYAMSDEYHQSFVPGRTAKVTDIGFDSLGMSIAYLRIRGFV